MAAINRFKVLIPMEKATFGLPNLKKPKLPKIPKGAKTTLTKISISTKPLKGY